MKKWLLAALLVCVVSLIEGQSKADDASNALLKNADFSDGTTHWRGDCKDAASETSTDLTANPQDTKGVVVDLRSSTWTTVTQEIRSAHAGASDTPLNLVIQYTLSGDFKLSDRATDYSGDDSKTGIGGLLGFSSAQIFGYPGQLLAFIDSAPANRTAQEGNMLVIYSDNVSLTNFTPAGGSAKTYSTVIRMPPVNGDDNPVFCVAIPPGHGSITFTKISLQPAR